MLSLQGGSFAQNWNQHLFLSTHVSVLALNNHIDGSKLMSHQSLNVVVQVSSSDYSQGFVERGLQRFQFPVSRQVRIRPDQTRLDQRAIKRGFSTVHCSTCPLLKSTWALRCSTVRKWIEKAKCALKTRKSRFLCLLQAQEPLRD